MPHVCPKCSREFSQKGHLEAHLNRIKTCEKCNVNFSTQYAYIKGECIHVATYKKRVGDKPRCERGHELVMCEGSKIKKYFRHKHSEDVGGSPMTEWHSRMQGYFPVTEVWFKKVKGQIKDRRADVFIKEHNYCVEIQHSHIDVENVCCRYNDYRLNDVNVLWLIDGNTSDVVLDKLSTGSFLITFGEDWKYKSFRQTYDFVLLDVDNLIFKIPVKEVCNRMVLVKESRPIEQVIKVLQNNPKEIWKEWNDDNEIKAKLIVHQKGAGNGKTYGIWESIATNLDKELFIIVTKQHSAKDVIKRELDSQADRREYHINYLSDVHKDERNRKHIVKYKHKRSSRECIVIIGTIDSLMYNLAENAFSNSNFFQGLLETIEEYGTTKVNQESGIFTYAGETLHLDKKAELWIDEAQDLDDKYFKAVTRLILETKIDVVIVGDKLQSLEHRDNFMTRVEEQIPNINILRETPINYNRRVIVDGMSDEINKLVHFGKYNLPSIQIHEQKVKRTQTLEIIDTPDISQTCSVCDIVQTIIGKVNDEVEKYCYLPNDFLFVFPIMKNNLVAIELETKLNEYWIDKIGDDNKKYMQYAMLHRHEEGQVIDTSLSDKASRIVSIRTSKGDGRNVVFVLDCTEKKLKLVSRSDSVDLIYDSYLHVALTRAKHKIYFGLTKNGDEINRRFGAEGITEYRPRIKAKLQHDKIIENIDNKKIIELMNENGIKEPPKTSKRQTETTQVIDWEFHCVRRAIYLQYAVFNIISNKRINKRNIDKCQINTVLSKIAKLPVSIRTPNEFYKCINNFDNFENFDDFFPLCNLSHKPIYKKYAAKIQRIINKNNEKIERNKLLIAENNPLEAVIQWYTIELYQRKKFCETKPTTIYNIFNHYEKNDETKITELMDESQKIKETTRMALDDILKTNDNIEWNIEHMIEMEGQSTEMNIWFRDIRIIGYDENNVYHFMFQTEFNELNFWNTIIKVMVERFIVFHAGGNEKNISKFKNKKIITYLFILKHTTYQKLEFDDASFSHELKQIISCSLIKHFCSFNRQLFQYCKFIKKHNKWKEEGFKSPYDFIANTYQEEYNTAGYVIHFFKMLHHNARSDMSEVKRITDSEELFCHNITQHIEDMVNTFLGLNNYIEPNDW